jgi:hypothetical protein
MSGPTDLQHRLMQLFEPHRVPLVADEEWLLTDGDFPAVRASWRPGTATDEPGRLDVDVVLDEARHIELSQAGAGATPLRDALDRFAGGDLPALLAACWYVTDDRMLELARWELGVHAWDVFLGRPQLEGTAVTPPATFFAALREALAGAGLRPQLHWVRLLLRRDADGNSASEALLDNEPWPAGDRLLTTLALAPGQGLRQLVLLDVHDY